MERLISTLAATVVALGLTMAAAPAGAAIDQTADHRPPASSPRAQSLPARPITITWDQVRDTTKVRLKGTAQDYAGRTIYLQERKHGYWKRIDKRKTTDAAKYTFTTRVPKDGHHHKYRVMTPKRGGYKKSYSQVIELYWT